MLLFMCLFCYFMQIFLEYEKLIYFNNSNYDYN